MWSTCMNNKPNHHFTLSIMEFKECYDLLSSRPQHSHDNCTHEHNENLNINVDEMHDGNTDDSCDNLSNADYIRLFFQYQETRVQIYQKFNAGFAIHKATTNFPAFCAEITDAFSKLNAKIHRIENSLTSKDGVRIGKIIRKTQLYEKEKLLMISALLVEKMRRDDLLKQSEHDEVVLSLLEQSIEKMTNQHTNIVENINSLLEELRMELIDLDTT